MGSTCSSFGFRIESPTLARWTTPDPTDFWGGDVNFYRSRANNPVGYVDPSGLDFLSSTEAVA
jgi:RHS repeat-associated protein